MKFPETPPSFDSLFQSLSASGRFGEIIGDPRSIQAAKDYFHWEDIKYRIHPKGFTREEWWLSLKLQRLMARRNVPLQDVTGSSFGFGFPDVLTELLHQIDRDGRTLMQIPEQVLDSNQRDRYLIHSLMEEAITSSQLEGAATTRDVAKKMLAEGRAPKDRSERMILNNYQAMRHIIELKNLPLTPELVFDLHRRISEDALDKEGGEGRFRRADEAINVSDFEGNVFHTPPPAEQLPERLQAMCDFANGKTPGYFIHPVIRGIILHFWLAYDHPFVDGNGRTARALFYWQMLHAGYWLFEFISISQIIRKALVQYGTAFLHTETDDNDLTYFILHQAEVIRRALLELRDYVAEKSKEAESSAALLGDHCDFNHRQQALLAHALQHPGFGYKIASHMAHHGIVYDTARLDLLTLAEHGLLEQTKKGKAMVFIAPANLVKQLRKTRER